MRLRIMNVGMLKGLTNISREGFRNHQKGVRFRTITVILSRDLTISRHGNQGNR